MSENTASEMPTAAAAPVPAGNGYTETSAEAAAQTAQNRKDYPEMTDGQAKMMRAGKLPGEMKLHVVTLLCSLFALVMSAAAIAIALN